MISVSWIFWPPIVQNKKLYSTAVVVSILWGGTKPFCCKFSKVHHRIECEWKSDGAIFFLTHVNVLFMHQQSHKSSLSSVFLKIKCPQDAIPYGHVFVSATEEKVSSPVLKVRSMLCSEHMRTQDQGCSTMNGSTENTSSVHSFQYFVQYFSSPHTLENPSSTHTQHAGKTKAFEVWLTERKEDKTSC